MTSEPDPPWLREAAGAIAHELLGWLRALAAVTRSPRRFCAEWAAGESHPLNPLAFALNTLALAGPAAALLAHLIGIEDDVLPLWVQILKPAFPWLYNLVWLVPVHFGLRALGGTRRLGTTVGAAFYAGGPLQIARIFYVPLQLSAMAHPGDLRVALTLLLSGFVMMALFCGYTSAALAGAHRMKAWRAAVVVVVVFVISAIVWAWIGIHSGNAGMRVIRAIIT